MNYLNSYLTQIFLALILALAAFLGTQIRSLYRKYVTTEIKQSVCRTAVRFVEQVYKDIHGPEKLMAAMQRASVILNEYGIMISDAELVAMLEAAVNEFNNAFAKDVSNGAHLPGTSMPSKPERDPEPVSTATAAEIIAEMKDLE